MASVSRRLIITGAAVSCALFAAGTAISAQQSTKAHRLLLQIDSDDVQTMNIVLGNAINAKKYYDSKSEPLEVEVVAYGPGIAMLRDDKSPVKDRIAEALKEIPKMTLSMCNNAKTAAEKREGHTITPLAGVQIVPAGIVRVMELQEQGWTYVKP